MKIACILLVLVVLAVLETSAYTQVDCSKQPHCPRPCTTDYKPVCGKNGCMYRNRCLLKCARVEEDKMNRCSWKRPSY